MLRAITILLLAGCQTMLDIEPPSLRPDASIDSATPATDPAPDAPTDARVCPPAPAGCTQFRCAATDSCYWTAAQSYCTQVTGCLATIESQEEQDCVAAASTPSNGSPVWIGAFQPAQTEDWQWACGSSSYAKWGSFEPNNLSGDQDCTELMAGGYWNDDACTSTRRFVCEVP